MKTIITVLFLAIAISTLADNENKNLANESDSENNSTQVFTGKIIDSESKESLVGVKVNIGDTGIVVYTDFNGNFSVEIPATCENAELTVSYISYNEMHVNVFEANQIIEISTVE